MAVRPIDAEKYMELLKEQYLHNKSMGNSQAARAWQGAIQLLYDMPTLTPPNEPLTLDELREMDGEPIYVTTENYGDGWCILNWHGVNKSYTYFSRTGTSEGMTATPISAKTYGDWWLAYRRPPEGEK